MYYKRFLFFVVCGNMHTTHRVSNPCLCYKNNRNTKKYIKPFSLIVVLKVVGYKQKYSLRSFYMYPLDDSNGNFVLQTATRYIGEQQHTVTSSHIKQAKTEIVMLSKKELKNKMGKNENTMSVFFVEECFIQILTEQLVVLC